jgi:hypothetical protein
MAGPGPLARLTDCLSEESRRGQIPVKTAELATAAKQLAGFSFRAPLGADRPQRQTSTQFQRRSRPVHQPSQSPRLRQGLQAAIGGHIVRREASCVRGVTEPLLAAICLAVATYYVAAPINPAVGPDQFWADICKVRAAFILTTASDVDALQLGHAW